MTEDALKIDAAKTAFNARAKASMRAYLKSLSWPEKIESIERMNEAGRLAREGMRKAGSKGVSHPSDEDLSPGTPARERGNEKAG